MEEENRTLPDAICDFVMEANKAAHFRGTEGYIGTLNFAVTEATDRSAPMLTIPKCKSEGWEKDFGHNLNALREELVKDGTTLVDVDPKDVVITPQKGVKPKLWGKTISSSPTPKPVFDFTTRHYFTLQCENPSAAIAALTEKTAEMKKIALETRAEEIVQSIANRIPKDMSPELAQRVVDGLGTLMEKTAKQHRVPLPKIAGGHETIHIDVAARNESLAL